MDLLFFIPQTSLAGMFATSIISSALKGWEGGLNKKGEVRFEVLILVSRLWSCGCDAMYYG
jgi:hypothetical protein